MDSATHYLSKNVWFNICYGKNSKVTAVNKFQKFRVDTSLNFNQDEGSMREYILSAYESKNSLI